MADIGLEHIKATWKEIARDIMPVKKLIVREPGDTETDMPAMYKLVASSVVFGMVLHQFFSRVEMDRYPLYLVVGALGMLVAQSIGLQEFSQQFAPLWESWQLALLVGATALSSLAVNIFVYRAYGHPLQRFPGPFGARLSKFWALGKVALSGTKWYQVVGRLQEQYPDYDYIRTGPREVTIFDPEAIEPILGVNSKTKKAPFYGSLQQSLHMTRDPDFHAKRRKVWDVAFKQTLSDYGPIIEEMTETLLERIESNEGKELLLNELCKHYCFDVMNTLAYGSSTQYLEGKSTKKATRILNNIINEVATVGALLQVPWLVTTIESLSIFGGSLKESKAWSAARVEKRKQMKDPKPDIIGHLLKYTQNDSAGRALLNADTRLIVGAGSEPTSSALIILFVLLATNPAYQHSLRKEVSASFKDKTYNSAKTQTILDSIITESLRLFPPVLSSSQRVIGEGGLRIGKIYLPEDTIVNLATYQIQRDPRNFERPNEFVPERWTSKSELVLNKAAYIPFSTGPYDCPGRGLAMMELRSVLSHTVQKYDILIPDREKFNEQVFYEGIQDHFFAGVLDCQIMFKKR